MNFYISNRKEREHKIFSELSSKSAKSRGTSKSSSNRQNKSKSNISVHSRTSVHSQPSVRPHSSSSQGKSNKCIIFCGFREAKKQPSMQNFLQIR